MSLVYFFSEPEVKENVLANLSKSYPVTAVDFETMLDIVTACQDLQQRRSPGKSVIHPLEESSSSSSSSSPYPSTASTVGTDTTMVSYKTRPRPKTRKKKPMKDLSIWAMLKGIVPGW